ncbi:DNA pilot protein [Tortoise microvirus 27]|nr:DNA pilot protein [Tortoise microvirus 27]
MPVDTNCLSVVAWRQAPCLGNVKKNAGGSMPLPFIIPAVAGLVGAGINAWSQSRTNKANVQNQQAINQQNIQQQQLANQQNEALTREAWARDDNAVQRRVQDLRAAGLSPVLAAGSPAGVSAPIKMGASQGQAAHQEAPQWGDMVTGALQGLQMAADYSMTKAQTNLIKQQSDTYAAQARYQNAQARLLETHGDRDYQSRINNMSTRTQIDAYDLEIARKWGIPHAQLHNRTVGLLEGLEGAGVRLNSRIQDLVQDYNNFAQRGDVNAMQRTGYAIQNFIRGLPGGETLFRIFNTITGGH